MNSGERHFFQAAKLCAAFHWQLDNYYKGRYTKELLCACPYFQVSRLHLQAATPALAAAVSTTNAFAVLLCISGSGTMTAETGETLAFQKGQCVFVPADTTVKELSGTADLLWITA